MINPENNIPLNDSQNSEADDQQSQKDIHSNGFDDVNIGSETDEPDTEMLNQAYGVAEPSYTLEPEKGIAKKVKS